MCASGKLHDVGRHHRGQHAGHDQREKHRDGRSPAKLHEELARYAGHERGRQKHRDQRERGGDDCQADLVGRLHGGLKRRLAHAQVAHDVLDLHDRIVHQDAHHQRERQQRHHIERKADQVHGGKCGYHRQRQGHGGDQGGAPVAQEQPYHQHGQHGTLEHQRHGAVEVLLHRIDEIESFGDCDVGVGLLEFLQLGTHAPGHIDLAGPAGARDLEADHRLAIEQRARALLGYRIRHTRYLVQPDTPAVTQCYLHARQFFSRMHGGDGAHRLFGAAHIGAAARGVLLHLAQLARYVGAGGAQGLQPGRVEFHPHFARDTADAGHGADATHRQDGLGHRVVDKPAQCLAIHAAGFDGIGQDRRA